MKNCLICTVDCLRYDGIESVSPEGGILDQYEVRDQLETPNMNRLLEQGTKFPSLHAPYASTPSSSTSILTGQYPREHGVYDYYRPLRGDVDTLADYFSNEGFHTLIMNGHFFFGKMGLGDRFDEVLHGPVNKLINRIKELNEQGERVFAYFHTMDVHPPYLISKFPPTLEYNDPAINLANAVADALGMDRQFDRSDLHLRHENREFDFMASPETPVWKFLTEHFIYHYQRNTQIFQEPVRELIKLYVQGINSFDDGQFSPLADFVLDDPMGQDTCFVLTSDHGQTEKTTDAGTPTFYHRGKPLEELIRVPGVILGDHKNLTNIGEKNLSSLVDITPTLLNLFKIPHDSDAVSGIDLSQSEISREYIYADFCVSVNTSETDDPIQERQFPLPGVLRWVTLIKNDGTKYVTNRLPVTESDYDLDPELFVRVVSEKLFNEWLPQHKVSKKAEQLEETGDYEEYVSNLERNVSGTERELYDLSRNPREKPETNTITNDDLRDKFDKHLAERFPTASELTRIVEDEDHREDEDTQAPLEGFGYL